MQKNISFEDLLNPGLKKEETLSGLMSKIEKMAKEDDAQAKEFLAQMEPLKLAALQIVKSREKLRESLDEQKEKNRKQEINHWVKRLLAKRGVGALRVTPEEMEIFQRLGVRTLGHDDALLKTWEKTFKVDFPDGERGSLDIDYDDQGQVSHVSFKKWYMPEGK